MRFGVLSSRGMDSGLGWQERALRKEQPGETKSESLLMKAVLMVFMQEDNLL